MGLLHLVRISFYSNMVWLSIFKDCPMEITYAKFLFQYGLIIYLKLFYYIFFWRFVSIPIWSDYLYNTTTEDTIILLRFYSNMVWLSIQFVGLATKLKTVFLFQYGLIIYVKQSMFQIVNLLCFYSNMVWLSIVKLMLNIKLMLMFLFQYGLIIYTNYFTIRWRWLVSIPIWSDYL